MFFYDYIPRVRVSKSAILVYGGFLEVASGLSTARNFAETAKKDGIYDNLGLAS